MFERSVEYAITRRKPHARAIRRTGTIIFLLAIFWFILPVVLNGNYLITLSMQLNGVYLIVLFIGIEVALLIMAILMWVSSFKGQKGTLTISWNKLHFQFGKTDVDLHFEEMIIVNKGNSKNSLNVLFVNKKKKDRSFPTVPVHDQIEFKSENITNIHDNIYKAKSDYLEWKKIMDEERMQMFGTTFR